MAPRLGGRRERAGRHFPAGAGEPVRHLHRRRGGAVAARLARTPGIASVAPPVTADGLVYLQGTLASRAGEPGRLRQVDRVRTAVHAIPGADAKVGGGTAVTMDVGERRHP